MKLNVNSEKQFLNFVQISRLDNFLKYYINGNNNDLCMYLCVYGYVYHGASERNDSIKDDLCS